MLTKKEIKHYKTIHGCKEFSLYLRYMEVYKRWKCLPTSFILQVLKNSEDSPINKDTKKGINRQNKRKIQKQLANSTIRNNRVK